MEITESKKVLPNIDKTQMSSLTPMPNGIIDENNDFSSHRRHRLEN